MSAIGPHRGVADAKKRDEMKEKPWNLDSEAGSSAMSDTSETSDASEMSDTSEMDDAGEMDDAMKVNHSSETIRVNPRSPKDITIHMSIPTADDLEPVLEEFWMLQRLGRFTAALEVFEAQLRRLLDNKYIQNQYAECLLRARRLLQLQHFMENHRRELQRPMDALAIEWAYIEWEAGIAPSYISAAGLLKESLRRLRSAWPALNSTELNILIFLLKRYPKAILENLDFIKIHDHFVEEGMIWEFRDLIECMMGEYLVSTSFRELGYSKGPAMGEVPELLCQEWWDGEVEEQDDSTLFALLDICAMLVAQCLDDAEPDMANQCLRLARQCATELVARDSGNAKSRPYLCLIVAQLRNQDREGFKCRNEISFKWCFLGTNAIRAFSAGFPHSELPIYEPRKDEVPEWKPRSMQPAERVTQTVKTVLRAAEDMGDLLLKAGCLHLLMYQDPKGPKKMLKQLQQHFRSIGDLFALRIMHLFMYMVPRTSQEGKQLRQDILDDGELITISAVDHHWQRIQYSILRALSPDLQDMQRYKDLVQREIKTGKRIRTEDEDMIGKILGLSINEVGAKWEGRLPSFSRPPRRPSEPGISGRNIPRSEDIATEAAPAQEGQKLGNSLLRSRFNRVRPLEAGTKVAEAGANPFSVNGLAGDGDDYYSGRTTSGRSNYSGYTLVESAASGGPRYFGQAVHATAVPPPPSWQSYPPNWQPPPSWQSYPPNWQPPPSWQSYPPNWQPPPSSQSYHPTWQPPPTWPSYAYTSPAPVPPPPPPTETVPSRPAPVPPPPPTETLPSRPAPIPTPIPTPQQPAPAPKRTGEEAARPPDKRGNQDEQKGVSFAPGTDLRHGVEAA